MSRNLIIACIESSPKAMVLMRTARSRAQGIGGAWRAVFVETPSQPRTDDDGAQERALRLLTLAQQMGGEAAHIEAETVEKGIAQVLEEEKDRVSLLIVGSNEKEIWWRRLKPSVSGGIVRLARRQRVAVEIVPLSAQAYRWNIRRAFRRLKLRHIASSLGAVGLAYLGASLMEHLLPPALFRINDQNVGLLFMVACAFVAGRFGLVCGLLASAASFITINYFFTVPYYELKLTSVTDALNMLIFFSAALLISLFSSQTRDYAEKVAKREMSTQALFTLYRIASDAFSRQQVLVNLQRKLTKMLESDVAFFLPPTLNPDRIEATYPEHLALEEADRKALEICWTEMKTTGLASAYANGATWRFEPMIAPGGEVGVLGIRPRAKTQLDAWFGRLLGAIADQTAAVLEHIELDKMMETTRIREEREKLRSMLLSSVSHDLRTPLAAIVGALGIYRSYGERLAEEKRKALIDTALEEADRLDRFITNILSMTRLESGTIEFKKEWHNWQELVEQVIKRMEPRLRQHSVVVHPHPFEAEGCMDAMMVGQVIQNVIDNACKYTPAGTQIEIRFGEEEYGQGFCCSVRDHGSGLPEEKLEQVFDKYARLQKKDSQVAGTGLGLAICKAVMEAQGGWISAHNHPEGGAVFTLCLPLWRKADATKYIA